MTKGNDRDRAAAIREGKAYDYASYVDNCPRDDTRAAAISEGCGYIYAFYVDECPRNDTRAAALKEGWLYEYIRFIDKVKVDAMVYEMDVTLDELQLRYIMEMTNRLGITIEEATQFFDACRSAVRVTSVEKLKPEETK